MASTTSPTRQAAQLLGLLVLCPPLAAQDLRPLQYNADGLVEQAVAGEIGLPVARVSVSRVEADSAVRMVPATGSITYNFRTGDSAVHMAGNHVEPAVSIYNPGPDYVYTGDYDIQLFDEDIVEEYGLESLRFGDIVAIINADHSYGRIYQGGAVSIGVVAHGRSDSAGHGPGVTTLFTSSDGRIQPRIDANANLGDLLEIR